MDITTFLHSLKGKTIENIAAKSTYYDNRDPFDNITLFFTDGTEMTLSSTITFYGDEHQTESAIEVEFKN